MIEVRAGCMAKSTACACPTCKRELARGEHVVLIEYDEVGPRALVLVGDLVACCDINVEAVRFYDTPEERDAAMPAIQAEMEQFFVRLHAGTKDPLSFFAVAAEPYGFTLSASQTPTILSVPRITAASLRTGPGPIVVSRPPH